tara:strand:+ start:147 stop:383 length:237 start_codon:yes stop_codon:yes gene_type:complete
MAEDPSHWSVGPVTAGAVFIRLAVKHDIDEGAAHAVTLIGGAVAAGLINERWAELTDGEETEEHLILTLTQRPCEEGA